MKKIYALFIAGIISMNMLFAGSVGCNIDSTNTRLFSPSPDSLPCVERGANYFQIIQIKVLDSINMQDIDPTFPFSYELYVDSLVIDSVTGFPTGMYDYINPYWTNIHNAHLYGGQNACTTMYGTTTDSVGVYPLTFHGTITVHATPIPILFDGDTTLSLEDLGAYFKDSLYVINQGDTCRPHSIASGINGFNAELNTAMSVYPNPNNGQFELKLNAGRRIDGEIVVTDITGRVVYSRQLDVIGYYDTSIDLRNFSKGLYTLQLRTADGFASKRISVE